MAFEQIAVVLCRCAFFLPFKPSEALFILFTGDFAPPRVQLVPVLLFVSGQLAIIMSESQIRGVFRQNPT